MACLGVLFSLNDVEVQKLRSFKTDQEKLDHFQEKIEEFYFENKPEYTAELERSWDPLHRSPTDGQLEYTNGVFPSSHIILGGEILYTSGDYIMTLKTPQQVKEIAEEVIKIDNNRLREGYHRIKPDDCGFPLTDEDFEYTWNWFQDSKEFWVNAARENRYVLFTADQ